MTESSCDSAISVRCRPRPLDAPVINHVLDSDIAFSLSYLLVGRLQINERLVKAWRSHRGMRMVRNAERTREKLLNAATEEFAAHGIAGARVDRIARLSGVSKPMIY